MTEESKKIKVLLVDDSALIRKIIAKELSHTKDIEVVGTAPDPYVARDRIIELEPEVIVLDLEMPRMDGIAFLDKLMRYYPLPVIIFSSLTPKGCATALRAMEIGAVEVIQKPRIDDELKMSEVMAQLVEKIRVAASLTYKFRYRLTERRKPVSTTQQPAIKLSKTTDQIVAIGASTGGVEALSTIVPMFPTLFPGVLVVQHMPERFTQSFADSLGKKCKMEVKEAKNGDTVRPGLVLIAPGNYHMALKRSGAVYYVQVANGPLVCGQRPSVDVLFQSVAKYAGANAFGVILTGMGRDGAEGLLRMKDAGAYTIAQDEKSCIVYGMPNEAVKLHAADKVLPLEDIPQELLVRLARRENEKGIEGG